jgi:glycosyltransferase A (GT-A) superfamily protein (DUF2064 family)
LNGAIAIFVKTPGLSPIKTRLAASTGRGYAETWYRLAAAAVAEVALTAIRMSGGLAYWAVAETQGMDHPLWSSLPRLTQGHGGLGQRMAQVHEQLLQIHGAGILLGADIPQVRREQLCRALAFLNTPSPAAVIGRAEDGGFWLFGSNRRAPISAWAAPEYGTTTVHATFRRAFGFIDHYLELDVMTDVDTAEQLDTVREALLALPDKEPAQAALCAWMAS